MIDNITDYIEFSTNTVVPDVYTNVHHKLLCVENSEQMLLNSTQIDWQEAHLKHINQIPGIQPEFRLNTTEELLWIIDTLVLKAFGVKSILSITTSGIQAYNGQQQRPTITVKEGDNVIDSSYYEVVFNEENSINAGTYTFNVNLTPEGEAKYAQPTQQTYTIPQRKVTITTTAQTTSEKTNIDQSKYTATGIINGHTLTNVVLSVNSSNKIIVSSYDIVDSNNNSVKSNYTLAQTNGKWTQQTTQVTYYWYVGQTDPSTMTEISPIVTSTTEGGGWYELGTNIPSTITQLIKGGVSGTNWYTAVPLTNDTTLKPVASDMSTLDTTATAQETKTFNNITYQIYYYGGVSGTRNTFRFAKK